MRVKWWVVTTQENKGFVASWSCNSISRQSDTQIHLQRHEENWWCDDGKVSRACWLVRWERLCLDPSSRWDWFSSTAVHIDRNVGMHASWGVELVQPIPQRGVILLYSANTQSYLSKCTNSKRPQKLHEISLWTCIADSCSALSEEMASWYLERRL